MSQLVHIGISISEIAGLTDVQMRHVHLRPRDRYGNLKRFKENTIKKPVSFVNMFRKVWASRGLDDVAIDAKWQEYLAENQPLTMGVA